MAALGGTGALASLAYGLQGALKRGTESPVDFWTREAASYLPDEEKFAYLLKQLPKDQTLVRRESDGALLVRMPDGTHKPIDPEGFDFPGDLADVSADVTVAAPATALALLGGSVAGLPGAMGGAGLGSATGESLRQLRAQSIDPGLDTDLGRIATEGVTGAAIEGVIPGGGRLIGKGIERAIKPWARRMQTGGKDGIRQSARRLDPSGRLEEALPASSLTENIDVQQGEQYLREALGTADKFRQRVDEPLGREVSATFRGIREGISPDVPISPTGAVASGFDDRVVNKALISTVKESRDLTSSLIGKVWDDFEALVDPRQIPISDTPNLNALLSGWRQKIQQSPIAAEEENFARALDLVQDAKINTLHDLDQTRRAVGEWMDTSLRKEAKQIYGAVMRDLEVGIAEFAMPSGVGATLPVAIQNQSGKEIMDRFRRYLDISSLQFMVDESPVVRKMFPKGEVPNIYVLDNARKEVFGSGVEAIRAFKQRIGVTLEGSGLREATDVARGRAGRAATDLPETQKGQFVYQQMQQLHLDNILRRISADPREFHVGGRRFYTELFGDLDKERVTQEIFGADGAKQLEEFALLLQDARVAQRFFANYSNTSVRGEISRLLESPLQGARKIITARGMAGQYMKPQGRPDEGGALLGKDFLGAGKIPDTSEYIRGLGQLALRELPGLGFWLGGRLNPLRALGAVKAGQALTGAQQFLGRQVEPVQDFIPYGQDLFNALSGGASSQGER